MLVDFIILEFIISVFAINAIGLIGLHLLQERERKKIRKDLYLAAPTAVKKKLRQRREYK
jgi:predicted metal-dependent TIM-barrel fold hydrolase